MDQPKNRPIVALTMGDVAGIGPEVIAQGWVDPRLHALARPLVIGDPAVMARALNLVDGGESIRVQVVASPEEAEPSRHDLPCLSGSRGHSAISRGVEPGRLMPEPAAPHTSS